MASAVRAAQGEAVALPRAAKLSAAVWRMAMSCEGSAQRWLSTACDAGRGDGPGIEGRGGTWPSHGVRGQAKCR